MNTPDTQSESPWSASDMWAYLESLNWKKNMLPLVGVMAHYELLEQQLAAAKQALMDIEERFVDGCDTYDDWLFMGKAARAALGDGLRGPWTAVDGDRDSLEVHDADGGLVCVPYGETVGEVVQRAGAIASTPRLLQQLEQERQDRDQLEKDICRALGERNDARAWSSKLADIADDLRACLADERALSNEMAAQLEHASFAYDPGGCQKMFEAWKEARRA